MNTQISVSRTDGAKSYYGGREEGIYEHMTHFFFDGRNLNLTSYKIMDSNV